MRINRALTAFAAIVMAASPTGPAAEVAPARAQDGVVTIGDANIAAAGTAGMSLAQVRFPPQPPRRAIGAAAVSDPSREGRFLGALTARGGAAGNHGDLYDNRDRGHSFFHPHHRPLVTRVQYDPALTARGLDYGLNDRLLFDAPTIGNSSTAVPGLHWRSLPRLALTRPRSPEALARIYANNALYVYPEHRDHDPELGDLLPANTPYYVMSQGSSGSDRAFVLALLDALAALRPATKTFLQDRGWLAPTLQMLLRRSMAGIATEEDYLSGAAHPTAFDETQIDRGRLIAAAQALTPQTAPPPVRIAMVAETVEGPPADTLAGPASERLFDTPFAIGRVALGPAELRRYRLRAVAVDADGRPLPVVWRVLRGVATLQAGPEGGEAAIEIPWGDPAPAPATPPKRPGVLSARVDVAAFANTPAGAGPPSFFSLYFPQDRSRSPGPDGLAGTVDYDAPPPGAYIDPILSHRRPWRDTFSHDGEGRLLGWRRDRRDGTRDDYTRHGLRVLSRDAEGRPLDVESVAYALDPPSGPDRRRTVVETGAPGSLRYDYAGPEDRLGVLISP